MSAERDETEADAKLVRNESAKLTATYINGMAIALFAVGALGPIFNAMLSASPAPFSRLYLAAITTLCFATSIGLHWAARSYIKGLKA